MIILAMGVVPGGIFRNSCKGWSLRDPAHGAPGLVQLGHPVPCSPATWHSTRQRGLEIADDLTALFHQLTLIIYLMPYGLLLLWWHIS